jgi:hypothetical protein
VPELMRSTMPERTVPGRSSQFRPRRSALTYLLALLAPLSIAAMFATWGASQAAAAAGRPANAASVWYVAPGGAASAPCGATTATACALIDTAVAQAAPGDTIKVAPGTYRAAATSDLVVLTKDLTLAGAGARRTVLNGGHLGTVLTVDPGVTATVTGLTIKGGTGTDITESGTQVRVGGGVLNEGTLTLDRDTVTGNRVSATATGAGVQAVANGGGVFNADGGTLAVTHCLVTDNSAMARAAGAAIAEAIGAGVSSFGSVESPNSQTSVEYSTIRRNSARATGAGAVGAQVTGSATAAGGGIGSIQSSDRPAVRADLISGNTAVSLGTGSSIANASGAGVFEADSSAANAIEGSAIIGNTARAVSTGTSQAEVLAAGIAVSTSSDGHALFKSVVRGNLAVTRATGGGEAETLSSGAGALAALTADVVAYSTISGNTARAESTSSGNAVVGGAAIGGAAASEADAIYGSVIDGNVSLARNTGQGSASAEGAIVAVESPVADSQISGNEAKATAAGTNQAATIEAVAAGGGILLAQNAISGSSASPISTSSLTRDVVAASYTGASAGLAQAAGGAIGSSTGITDSAVLDNRATAAGSGTGTLVTGLSLPGITAGPRSPAAPDLARAGIAGLTSRLRSTILAMVRRPLAARLPARSGTRSATTSTLTSAVAGAGGIDGLTGQASNTTISDNRASAVSTGSGIAFTSGAGISNAGQLTAVTVAGNIAKATGPAGSSVAGGGVGVATSLANSIIAGNSPSDCGTPAGKDAGGNLDSDGTCGLSAARGSISAGNAMLAMPRFNGGPTKTQALLAGSQAIGLGVAATCEQLAGPGGVLDTDQRGRPRNSAARGVCDSGAYDTGGVTAP